MKIYFVLISIALNACAASPAVVFRAAPSKTEMGYWEKTLSEKGAYEVHAMLPLGLANGPK
jgi:hypothetical protein